MTFSNVMPSKLTLFKLFNFIGFQVCWFTCILGPTQIAAVIVGLFYLCHLISFSKLLTSQRREILFTLLVASIGIVWDHCLFFVGILEFQTSQQAWIPAWLCLLWLAFSTTIRSSLAWMTGKTVFIVLCAATFAPLSYLAGSTLSSLTLAPTQIIACAIIGLGWVIMLTIFYYGSQLPYFRCEAPKNELGS